MEVQRALREQGLFNFQQCSTRVGPLSGRRVRHGGVRDVAGVRPLLQTLLLLDAQDGAQQVEAGEASKTLFRLRYRIQPKGEY